MPETVSLRDHIEKSHNDHRLIHERIDTMQVALTNNTNAIEGLRVDISPIITVFDKVLTYWQDGKFLRRIIWRLFLSVGTICAIFLSIRELFNAG